MILESGGEIPPPPNAIWGDYRAQADQPSADPIRTATERARAATRISVLAGLARDSYCWNSAYLKKELKGFWFATCPNENDNFAQTVRRSAQEPLRLFWLGLINKGVSHREFKLPLLFWDNSCFSKANSKFWIFELKNNSSAYQSHSNRLRKKIDSQPWEEIEVTHSASTVNTVPHGKFKVAWNPGRTPHWHWDSVFYGDYWCKSVFKRNSLQTHCSSQFIAFLFLMELPLVLRVCVFEIVLNWRSSKECI